LQPNSLIDSLAVNYNEKRINFFLKNHPNTFLEKYANKNPKI
jgi:hypothetical protein